MSKILIEDGPEKKRFRVTLDTYKNTSFLDLRYWYHDDDSNDLKPTKKGIAITSTNYLAFKSVVSHFDEKVMEHLFANNPHNSSIVTDENQNECINIELNSITKIEIEFDIIKPSFLIFEVDYQGSCAVVTLNLQHNLIKNYNLKNASKEQLKPIAAIFVSMDLAMQNIKSTEVTSPIVTIEQLLYELSTNVI